MGVIFRGIVSKNGMQDKAQNIMTGIKGLSEKLVRDSQVRLWGAETYT